MIRLSPIFTRQFSCSRIPAIYAKTSINPSTYTFSHTADAKAGVVFATPSLLPRVIEECSTFHQHNPSVQVVVAGVDSVLNSTRNGVSELWLPSALTVESYKKHENDEKKEVRESDGINVVSAKENWKLTESILSLTLNNSSKLDLTLANTLFSTGHASTLFVLDQGKAYSGESLRNLSVSVSVTSGGDNGGRDVKILELLDSWAPLYDSTSPPLIITKSIGNLVKELNGKSASSFLQDNAKLMSIGSKDTKVYVKLYKKKYAGEKAERFEVIAGGGGWGAKASTIVISPEADIEEGDKLEFFMLTPTDRFKGASTLNEEEIKKDTKDRVIGTFECSYEQTTYHEPSTEGAKIFEGLISAGSEAGFQYNGIQHVSAGESVKLQL